MYVLCFLSVIQYLSPLHVCCVKKNCDRADLFGAMFGTCDSYQYKICIHLVCSGVGWLVPRNSSLVDSIDLNNAAAAASLQCAHIGILYANSRTGRACGARGSALPAAHQPPYYLVRCAPPRSHEAARDLMTRARFRLERVSVSKNEQSASQACLTLQCTAFEKRPHISSGGF